MDIKEYIDADRKRISVALTEWDKNKKIYSFPINNEYYSIDDFCYALETISSYNEPPEVILSLNANYIKDQNDEEYYVITIMKNEDEYVLGVVKDLNDSVDMYLSHYLYLSYANKEVMSIQQEEDYIDSLE